MGTSKTKTAIIGATSHIAKSLIFFFNKEDSIELHCYARDFEALSIFLKQIKSKNAIINSFSEFNDDNIDVIINCVGISYIIKPQPIIENVFELTEKFDLIILTYIKNHPTTKYINFSSGAVYGTSFKQAATISTKTSIEVNNILPEDYYRIAKLNSEAKHRSLSSNNIIDLRIFGYYSRFIDLTKNYLMTEILLSIKENRTLKTSPSNIIRDYIHPHDLYNLVKACFEGKKNNFAMDVKSVKPISKMEILNFFALNYKLKFDIIDNYDGHSSTGEKLNYYSENKNTGALNFKPMYSSIDSISMETKELFKLFS